MTRSMPSACMALAEPWAHCSRGSSPPAPSTPSTARTSPPAPSTATGGRSSTSSADIQEVRLIGVDRGRLCFRYEGRDEGVLDRLSVDTIVDLSEGTLEIP